MYDCAITACLLLRRSNPGSMYRHETCLPEALTDCHARPRAHSKLHHCQCFAQRWLSEAPSSKLELRMYLAHACPCPLDSLLLTQCSHPAKRSVHVHLLLLIAGKVLGLVVSFYQEWLFCAVPDANTAYGRSRWAVSHAR